MGHSRQEIQEPSREKAGRREQNWSGREVCIGGYSSFWLRCWIKEAEGEKVPLEAVKTGTGEDS